MGIRVFLTAGCLMWQCALNAIPALPLTSRPASTYNMKDSVRLEWASLSSNTTQRQLSIQEEEGMPKKLLTRVSKPMPGVHGKRGLERGWRKRLAKGWLKVAKGWRRVGKGLAGFLAPSNFAIPETPV